jgi:O-antigen ligase
VFLQVIILLLVAVRVGGATILSARADRAALMATSFALLLTYTRGFWLSTLLGLAVIFVLTGPRGRVRFAAGALVGVLGLIALAQVADVGLVDSLVRRIVKTFDPDRDISVALRLDLYPRLLARIAERPIFGYGFGLLVENQTYYENSYLYFLIKMGIAGTLVVLWSWLLPLREASRLAHLGNDAYARAVSAGLAASLVSMLAVTAINPFINSSPGLYFLAVTCAALHAFRRAARPHAIGARGGGGSASW